MLRIRSFAKYLMLFLTGGYCYGMIEVIYKGNTHYSMFILGGICLIVIGKLNSHRQISILHQMILSSFIITSLEFICGCIVNIWFNLGVWDYSRLPLNLWGQICVLFVFIWFFISPLAILMDDFIRHRFFGEPKPHYYFIRNRRNPEATAKPA